jgi:hypothetical protein
MKTRPKSYRYLRVLLLTGSCLALLSSGCATFANGRHQKLRVETNPPTAKVSVQGTQRTKGGPLQFETPGEIVLHRKEKQVTLRIEKDGYEPEEVTLKRNPSGWTPFGGASWLGFGVLMRKFFGKAAYGAICLGITVGIDLLTGAAYQLDPATVSVTLQRKAVLSQSGDLPVEGIEPAR